MKKITIVTRNMLSGGAERVIAQLANYLSKKNIECSIITLDNNQIFYDLDDSIKVIPVGKKSDKKPIDKYLRYKELRRIIVNDLPDVVLSLPEDIGIYVILALMGTKVPVYVSERNNPWVMPDVKITRLLRQFMYPLATGIIFQTEEAKSFFSKKIQKKGIVLKNPVDASRIPNPYQGTRKKTFVAVGRLEPQKNFTMLINAFALFNQQNKDYKLIIYGEGNERKKLEDQIRKLGLENYVDLPGRNNDVLEKIKDASAFILSSDYEGMPNVLIEAMCMGMPVISTDCPSGGPRELIKDSINGLFVPVSNEECMYEAMKKIIDESYAKEIGKNAYKLKEQLTDCQVFKAWEDYLLEKGNNKGTYGVK